MAGGVTGRRIPYTVPPLAVFAIGGRFIGPLGEVRELLPRYRGDNVFDVSKGDLPFLGLLGGRRSG